MVDSEILELYDKAIEMCERWRLGDKSFTIQKATPNQLHLYNVFTRAKNELSGHQACIEDSLGVYMKRKVSK